MQKSSLLQQVSTVGSVAVGTSLAGLPARALHDICDIIELRLDAWPELRATSCEIARQLAIPVLLTARAPSEGGMNQLSAAQRTDLVLAHLPHAALVDVEIASLSEMSDLLAACRAAKVPVVGSFHDFAGTPPLTQLLDMLALAKSSGLAGAKFALTLHSPRELAQLLELLHCGLHEHHFPTAVMGMGELGKISRLALAKCGSCLNYGYLDAATVPGQWAAAELRQALLNL